MPNDTYREEQVKPGVRRLVQQPQEKEQGGERTAMQALLKQLEPGPTRTLLAKLLKHLEIIEEE